MPRRWRSRSPALIPPYTNAGPIYAPQPQANYYYANGYYTVPQAYVPPLQPYASPSYPYVPAQYPAPELPPHFTNRAPLPDEMIALQATLQMKEDTIAFLDKQIEAARENLERMTIPYNELRARFESAESAYMAAKHNHEDLVEQRADMDETMHHLHALLHPLRRFPSKLLAKVFLFAINAEYDHEYTRIEMSRSRRPQAVLTISRVCSRWRSVAQETPQLWTYVRLNLSRRTTVTEKLRHFLHLAKDLPMDVSTSNLQPAFFGSSSDSEEEFGSSALPLLANVKHLRSLTVNYTHYRALQFLPSLGTKCLDRVEELHIRSEPLSSPSSGLFSIASYLAEAINLRVLRLTHVHLLAPQVGDTNPRIQLPSVKELAIYGPLTHGSEILGFGILITMFPGVETVLYHQNDTIAYIPAETTVLEHLKALHTNSVALENALRQTFGTGRVVAPNLTSLFISDIPNPLAALTSFLTAVTTITQLLFYGEFDPFANVQMPPSPFFLSRAPNVTKLDIKQAHPKLLEALAATDEQTDSETPRPLCLPALQHLRLGVSKTFPFGSGDFLALFNARCCVVDSDESGSGKDGERLTSLGCPPLRKLKIHISNDAAEMLADLNFTLREKMHTRVSDENSASYRWRFMA